MELRGLPAPVIKDGYDRNGGLNNASFRGSGRPLFACRLAWHNRREARNLSIRHQAELCPFVLRFGSFLLITSSAPPALERRTSISSIKAFIRKIPRPEVFMRFSSARQSGTSHRLNPLP